MRWKSINASKVDSLDFARKRMCARFVHHESNTWIKLNVYYS